MKKLSLIVVCCFCGCALFQKTSSTTAANIQSSTHQLESSQLVLKTAGKETQIYTYWNDSGFYQYQHIKEQIDQAELSSLKAEEKQEVKQRVTTKKTEPVRIWIYVAILIVAIGCYWITGFLIWYNKIGAKRRLKRISGTRNP